jgi:hypothetical protein
VLKTPAKKTVKRQRAPKVSYSLELANRICEELSKGIPLRTVCAKPGMPSYSAVRKWEIENEEFKALSIRAREIGCHAIADECMEIADNATNDWMETVEDGNTAYKLNGEHIQRSRLRIETRMRLLGKWLPKVYGDKIAQEITGANGGPVVIAGAPTDADL